MVLSHSFGNGRAFSRFRCRSFRKPIMSKAVEARVLARKDFRLRLRTGAPTTIPFSRSCAIEIKILLWRFPMNTHSISRRKFAHLLGVGAAAAIVRPRFTIATEAPTLPAKNKSGVVRLSANENPNGPSAKAHKEMKNGHPASHR